MKTIKYIIFFLILFLCSSCMTDGKFYKKTASVPLAPGLRLGVFKESTPTCGHDMSTLDRMKDEAAKSSANWRKVAFWTSLIAFVATVVWYVGHIPQAGGVAICSILYSAFSTLMAVAMTTIWLVVLLVGVVVVIGLGIFLHKKSFFRWLRGRKRKPDPNHFVGEGLL